MARSKDSSNDKSSTAAQNRSARSSGSSVTWVNPYLNEVDQDWLESHLQDMDGFILGFLHSLHKAYSVTVTYDRQAERWSARCYCNAAEHVNTGYAVSVRAASSLDAWYALAYCCEVKLNWKFSDGAVGNSGRWG